MSILLYLLKIMARCMFPYYVERKIFLTQSDRTVPVPCGKCPECLKRRTASWSFRLEMESLRWSKQYFLTLTYNTENVPISDNGFMTLKPDDVTKFLKRLRKVAGKCRYYLCGEYGTNNHRPHYHMILFGTDSMTEQDIIDCWTIPKVLPKRDIGVVHFGKVEPASIRYTIQYFDKGVWHKNHKRDDRHPEFSRMSQGLGSNFLTPSMVNMFLNDPSKSYIYDREGRKIAIPRYYKQRLYDYFGSDSFIANNPSILMHRDDMLEAKERHNKAIEKVMSELDDPDDDRDPKELHEARKWAIINYRNSKTKTRKV